MQPVRPLEAILRRDRLIVFAALVLMAASAWAYLGYLAWDMDRDDNSGSMFMAMSQVMPWARIEFGLTFFMWAGMMMAMMVPTAAPILLIFAVVNRRRFEHNQPFVPTGMFLLGYLIVWFAFAFWPRASSGVCIRRLCCPP